MTGINRVTIKKIFKVIRMRIAEIYEQKDFFANGKIERDENYFGARRTRRVRGRGARGKMIFFGLIKRKRKVYTQRVETCLKR